MPNWHAKELFQMILFTEHFPSLKFCQFSGEFGSLLELDPDNQIVNGTIRTLILSQTSRSELKQILCLLPQLHRCETSIVNDLYSTFLQQTNPSSNFDIPFQTSLEHLCLTVHDPYEDLENILAYTSHLKQLRITGRILENSVFIYFEKLAKLFRCSARDLHTFDCELYFHAQNQQADIVVIQQLHPLFKTIHCHRGPNINQCYTTDLTEYPKYSEYSRKRNEKSLFGESSVIILIDVERVNNWTEDVYNDSDDDYYDRRDHDYYDEEENNGWVNYGLGYRGNYKANYGSSPWSGNNDD